MHLENGVWVSAATTTQSSFDNSPALFLDRDGVLVQEVNYLARPEDVVLERGAVEIIKLARAHAMPVIVVTNQAGIARGYFDWAAFEAVDAEIGRQLAARDVYVDLTIACPFHPDFTPHFTPDMGEWRKPGPAMLNYAATILSLDKTTSWMIGDMSTDIEAAKAAGLAGAVHLLCGHGKDERQRALSLADIDFHVEGCADLTEAARFLSSRLGDHT